MSPSYSFPKVILLVATVQYQTGKSTQIQCMYTRAMPFYYMGRLVQPELQSRYCAFLNIIFSCIWKIKFYFSASTNSLHAFIRHGTGVNFILDAWDCCCLGFPEFCSRHSKVTWKQLDPFRFAFKALWLDQHSLQRRSHFSFCALYPVTLTAGNTHYSGLSAPAIMAQLLLGVVSPDAGPHSHIPADLCSTLLSGALPVSPLSALGLWNSQLHLLDPENAHLCLGCSSMFHVPAAWKPSRQETVTIRGLPPFIPPQGTLPCVAQCPVSENHCSYHCLRFSQLFKVGTFLALNLNFLIYKLHEYKRETSLYLKGGCGPAYKPMFIYCEAI